MLDLMEDDSCKIVVFSLEYHGDTFAGPCIRIHMLYIGAIWCRRRRCSADNYPLEVAMFPLQYLQSSCLSQYALGDANCIRLGV